MASPASVGGHPLHPMLIPFPIALWVFSFIMDVLFLWRGDGLWYLLAKYTLAGGIVGALAAALPGIIDYFGIKDRKVSKVAAWHARINVLATLVFAVSLFFRTRYGVDYVGGSISIPTALSGFGVLLIAISGWLGGELVYKYGVSVEPQHDTPLEERDKARVS
jgi:uncharacterized membrane protein